MFPNNYLADYFDFNGQKYVVDEDLYRVNHDSTLWRPNLPEVFPFEPNHFTRFTRGYQLLEKSLNTLMTGGKWRSLHADDTAFNNGQGYDKSGDPRCDWVNLRDLTRPEPRQEALVCGGAVLKKRFIDNEYLYPEYIDGNQPPPTLSWLLKRPWLYFDAVTVDGTANGIAIRRFPQGDGRRVFVLLLASKPIKIPLAQVTKLSRKIEIPSPYSYP